MFPYIIFHWSGTPVNPHLVFCMHFCVWRCIPDVSMERDTPCPSTLPPFYSPVFVFFVKNPEVESLDHTVVLFLISWETSIMFSLVVVPTYIPTNSAQKFPFLHILSNTCYFCLFEYSNSDRHKMLSQLCFNFHVPDNNVDVCVCSCSVMSESLWNQNL